jgi:hypothetical protein
LTTREIILKLFAEKGELTAKEITLQTGFSRQMVHLVLKQLLEKKVLEKQGRTPKTIYRILSAGPGAPPASQEINEAGKTILKKYLVYVTETGKLLEGPDAFGLWCHKRGLYPAKTIKEFTVVRSEMELHRNDNGLINGINKLKNTKGYDKVHLDHLFYLDFYAIERFGKTRLGTLLHHAKQGQNKFLMNLLMQETREKIRAFITGSNANAIAFIPPTLRREVQFIRHMQNDLQLPLPTIDIKKLNGLIPIPQRSLQTLDSRIQNADSTFIISEKRKFRHVILIDDETNSGATFNQVAGKLKARGIAEIVTGLAIAGQIKGFEATTELKVVA